MVAVIILEILNKSECVIDSFVMSCRAMGFSLEKALIDYVVLYCIKSMAIKTYLLNTYLQIEIALVLVYMMNANLSDWIIRINIGLKLIAM